MKVGYARVNTIGQSLEVQKQKLKEAGCEKIFEEKKTGTRAEFKKALEYVREGVFLKVVVTKIMQRFPVPPPPGLMLKSRR